MDTPFGEGLKVIVIKIVDVILTPIIWLLVGVSFIMFFYGIVVFLTAPDGNEKAKGKRHMLYGILGLFLIFAVWGVISVISGTIESIKGY